MNIPDHLVTKWMFFLRENPKYLNRFTECFWPSQMKSKAVVLDYLEKLKVVNERIYIFGGWYGVLAALIQERMRCTTIYNVDIDSETDFVFKRFIKNANIRHHIKDMAEYEYPFPPDIVINTSTEHVSQEVYDAWWEKIPSGTKYIIQGNNFFDLAEHVRCSNSLGEFLEMNRVMDSCSFTASTDCGPLPDGEIFYRYTAAGVKL